MRKIDLLALIRQEDAARYQQQLGNVGDIGLHTAHHPQDMHAILRDNHTDVLVIDNRLERAYSVINELRQSYPRLMIVLVDEEADFGMPGQADEISTEPFMNNDLVKKVRRMISDRQMETVRSDTLPAVRNVAKRLRGAPGILGKQQAGVQSCKELGFDYVAYYHKVTEQPLALALKAHEGPTAIQAIAPKESAPDDLMMWVVANGQSRIASPEDRPNHPLVTRGRLGAIACVPCMFNGVTYGAIAAMRDRPGSITQENVLLLELIASQMAAAMAQEIRR